MFAWLSVLLTSGWIVYQVSTADDIGRICTSVISLIVDAMLIFALQKRRPSLFLPFIILEVCSSLLLENSFGFLLCVFRSYFTAVFLSFHKFMFLLIQTLRVPLPDFFIRSARKAVDNVGQSFNRL